MRNFSKFLAAAAGLACAASLAFAAQMDQTILGKSLTVKQNPADATSRKVTGVAKDKNAPATLVGDPTQAGSAGGAILQVVALGPNSSNQCFILPQGMSSTGKPFWKAAGTTGFKYKDPKGDQGPVKSVSIKRSPSGSFSIKAKISGKHGIVDVVPPNPGTQGSIVLDLGISPSQVGDRYSVQFGPESDIKNSGDKLFKAKKPQFRGVETRACPTPTTTTTSSTSAPTSTSTTTSTPTTIGTSTTTSSTTSTTMYGSPSRAFLAEPADLLD